MIKRILQILGFASLLACLTACSNETKNENTATETPAQASNETPDDLGASFLMAVKHNDAKYIETFLPSVADVAEIMNDYEGNKEEKKQILNNSDKNTKDIRRNTIHSIEEVRSKGNKNGIEWKDAAFSTSELSTRKENNIEFAKLIIYFKSGNLFKMEIPECIKSDRGWLIFDKPKWIGK